MYIVKWVSEEEADGKPYLVNAGPPGMGEAVWVEKRRSAARFPTKADAHAHLERSGVVSWLPRKAKILRLKPRSR